MVKAFVAGWPISHSKSPALHRFWLDDYGIDGSYEALPIPQSEFPGFLDTMIEQGFAGGNITIPHKEAACKRISCVDAAATRIGAVNTVWTTDGVLQAGNTDAYGFSANLDDYAPQWRKCEHAVVLGAGGASRAVIYALQDAGIGTIRIVNRTLSRARDLATHFAGGCSAHGLDELPGLLPSTDSLINTTSIGMVGTDQSVLPDLSNLSPNCLVTDLVYTPLNTPLLKFAASRGCKTVDGLGMLLHQAVPGFEKWFGIRPEVSQELRNHMLELS